MAPKNLFLDFCERLRGRTGSGGDVQSSCTLMDCRCASGVTMGDITSISLDESLLVASEHPSLAGTAGSPSDLRLSWLFPTDAPNAWPGLLDEDDEMGPIMLVGWSISYFGSYRVPNGSSRWGDAKRRALEEYVSEDTSNGRGSARVATSTTSSTV